MSFTTGITPTKWPLFESMGNLTSLTTRLSNGFSLFKARLPDEAIHDDIGMVRDSVIYNSNIYNIAVATEDLGIHHFLPPSRTEVHHVRMNLDVHGTISTGEGEVEGIVSTGGSIRITRISPYITYYIRSCISGSMSWSGLSENLNELINKVQEVGEEAPPPNWKLVGIMATLLTIAVSFTMYYLWSCEMDKAINVWKNFFLLIIILACQIYLNLNILDWETLYKNPNFNLIKEEEIIAFVNDLFERLDDPVPPVYDNPLKKIIFDIVKQVKELSILKLDPNSTTPYSFDKYITKAGLIGALMELIKLRKQLYSIEKTFTDKFLNKDSLSENKEGNSEENKFNIIDTFFNRD